MNIETGARTAAALGLIALTQIGIKYKSTKTGAYKILTKVNLFDNFMLIVSKIRR